MCIFYTLIHLTFLIISIINNYQYMTIVTSCLRNRIILLRLDNGCRYTLFSPQPQRGFILPNTWGKLNLSTTIFKVLWKCPNCAWSKVNGKCSIQHQYRLDDLSQKIPKVVHLAPFSPTLSVPTSMWAFSTNKLVESHVYLLSSDKSLLPHHLNHQ